MAGAYLDTRLKGRDYLTISDFSGEEIRLLLDAAHELKKELKAGIPHPVLKGKSLGMIFTKASTRTRVSFEVGMYQLGGYPLFLSAQDIQLRRGETVGDTARTLERYLDGIMIRTFAQADVDDLARYGSLPVINGLTDLLHPTQALADIMTVEEHKGRAGRLEAGLHRGRQQCRPLPAADLRQGGDAHDHRLPARLRAERGNPGRCPGGRRRYRCEAGGRHRSLRSGRRR